MTNTERAEQRARELMLSPEIRPAFVKLAARVYALGGAWENCPLCGDLVRTDEGSLWRHARQHAASEAGR